MSYFYISDEIKESTGARQFRNISSGRNVWDNLWGELLKTTFLHRALSSCTTVTRSIATEVVPVLSIEMRKTTADMVKELQNFFGINVKETADILKVSRPMIYHYQKGKEPAIDNKRRLVLLNSIVDEWDSLSTSAMKVHMKTRQPEGKTLFDYLNEENINITAIREIMRRATTSDRRIREDFAKSISAGETVEQRRDIARERHAAGKVVYVADPNFPNKIVQVHADGTRTLGRIINRKFVPEGDDRKDQ
jgi:hypothetical protein